MKVESRQLSGILNSGHLPGLNCQSSATYCTTTASQPLSLKILYMYKPDPRLYKPENSWVPFPATASFSLSFFTYGIKHVSINQGKVRIDASVCLLQSSSKHSTHMGYPVCLCSLVCSVWVQHNCGVLTSVPVYNSFCDSALQHLFLMSVTMSADSLVRES